MCKSKISLSIALLALSLNVSASSWNEIRKQRISQLLPKAMASANVDAWISICRENNNDPLAEHIGCENAGAPAAVIFYRSKSKFNSIVFSPVGEATALKEMELHDKVVPVPRGSSAVAMAAELLNSLDLKTIAINSSVNNAQADGLSYSQYLTLSELLGATKANALVSSEELVYQWLSIKLPTEISIMAEAARITAQWQEEAYRQVIPGKTTDAELAAFLKSKMKQLGVTDAWAPDQNPNVNSGSDRGHSHATDKVIMPGDIIQIDFGIKVEDRWVTDIQRFAYVLKPDELEPPDNIAHYWNSAKAGSRAAFAAMKPGARGVDVDEAQRKVMESQGSLPVMWSTGHPVGYVAHDTGPNLGGSRGATVRPASKRKLQSGMVFAFDGFYSWTLPSGGVKTISVEEMVEITEDGAKFLTSPQEELILIRSKKYE
ncbi:MAG: aminopeptidase P family protein [Gammaproteobacteria bacterium]|nr:aminopeptidase P family protein [Gammaproteobacteria bacterium]